MNESDYTGVDNLEAMKEAINYRRYFADLIQTLVPDSRRTADHALAAPPSVIDFGAGVGTYAEVARSRGLDVLCVESDARLRDRLSSDGFRTVASLNELPTGMTESVYTFNVLEHIEDDCGILAQICRVLEPGGKLLVYVPAFPVLYSSMDKKVGHVRRYRKSDLKDKIEVAGFVVDRLEYVDSLGFLASLAYRALGRLEDGELSPRSVRTYDRLLFPLSRRLDRALKACIGKNLLVSCHAPPDGGV
jgi:SAM-dependent methyltransferase